MKTQTVIDCPIRSQKLDGKTIGTFTGHISWEKDFSVVSKVTGQVTYFNVNYMPPPYIMWEVDETANNQKVFCISVNDLNF